MSVGFASSSVVAAVRGVPRFQSFAMRAYPDVVMLPSPKLVETITVLASTHARPDFASGRKKPSLTKDLVTASNSRTSVASAPPRERLTRQSRYSGCRQLAPRHAHFA